MKKIFVSTLLTISLFSGFTFAQAKNSTAPKTAEVKQAIEVPFVNKTLANGLEVIVLPDKSVPLVTVEIAVRNGSFTEPLEFNGLSHLYEHMFFKPNKAVSIYRCESFAANARTDPRYMQAFQADNCGEKLKFKSTIGNVSYLGNIGQMGITYNGTTREEVVNYFFTTTSPYLTTAIKFISDAIRFPNFDSQELEQEKRVVIGEIDRNEALPGFYLNNALQDKLYYKYPTRKKPLGTRETVLSATVQKMETIKNRYYVPNNAALIVTGDVNPSEVFKLAEQNLGGWEKRAVDPFKEFPIVNHPPLTKSEGEIVIQPVNIVLTQAGWHGPSIGKDDEATYAADVFSYILGQPDSKFQRALIDTGLAVTADVSYYTQRNVGPITLTLVTSPEKAKQALKVAYEQIAQFDKPDYYSDQELENAKTLLESRDLFEREKPSTYSHTLGFWWSSTGIDYFRGYHRNLRAVSRGEINRYVRTYIQGKPHIGVALISKDAQSTAKLTEADLIGK
ncbi:MAG: M16 family metallopeptidase [Aridibacter sp.]